MAALLTHRYREQGDHYRWVWFAPEPGPVHTGPLSERPDWLQAVVNAGKIGDHATVITSGYTATYLPMYVLWFTTDADFNFIAFLNKEPVP